MQKAAARLRSLRRVRRTPKPGEAPGVLSAHEGSVPSEVSVIAYGPDDLLEREISDLSELSTLKDRAGVTWINVNGLGTVDVLHRLGELFSLHPLALEDVLNVPQRPKADDYGENLFVVARMPMSPESLLTEQISFFFGDGYLISFQEREGDCFGPIRERIRSGRPRIRSSGSDYLAYALLDAIIDAYFPPLEAKAERLEELEFEILERTEQVRIRNLYDIKRDLVLLRRYLWPMREVLTSLVRDEQQLIDEKTRLFLRDALDHTNQALDLIDSYRDIASGLMDLYLSMVSQRMNDVMKVLTIIATVFIPLSFIAGVYGMNFNTEISPWNLPELNWVWGYRFALALMLGSAIAMLIFFWRKGWFR